MRKIISFLLAATMFGVNIVTASSALITPYEVYNINFEEGIPQQKDLDFGSRCEYISNESGQYIKVNPDEDGSVYKLRMKLLEKKSDADISVRLGTDATEAETKFKLIAYLTHGENISKYVLDKRTVKGDQWITLSGRISTRILSIADIQIGISAVSDGAETVFLLDDFKVTSSKKRIANEAPPVKEVKNDGNFYIRGTFENDTFERWYLNTDADYDCTDEVLAHTGKRSFKAFNRIGSFTTLICQINTSDVDKNTALDVSCWVKKHPKDSKITMYIQHSIPLDDGTTNWKFHDGVTIEDDDWHELKAIIDLSKFKLGDGIINIQISSGDKEFPTYYADDFVISGNKPGEFYDDFIMGEIAKETGMSDTVYKPSGFYREIQQDIPSLKDVYKDYFKIGGTGWYGHMIGKEDRRFTQLFLKHCNSYSDNGAFKMPDILPDGSRENYDFSRPDAMMDFAVRNGIDDIVGHTFVWEGNISTSTNNNLKNSDGSLIERESALSFMKEYITKVMKHFEGDGDPSEYAAGVDYSNWHINVWDVVNEAYRGDGVNNNYKDYGQGWFNVVGSDYIELAFRYADEVCKENDYDIDLRYNDFHEQTKGHTQTVYTRIKELREKGVRIDNVGFQSHFGSQYNTALYRDAIELIASLGVHIDATEIDSSPYTEKEMTELVPLYEKGVPTEVELTQANIMYDVFETLKEYSDIVDRATLWTYCDGISWWNNRKFKHIDYAGFFDRDYQAKSLYWAIADPAYYFENYLKEDTSKIRLSVNGEVLELGEEELFEENSVAYVSVDTFLEEAGLNFEVSGAGHALASARAAKQSIEPGEKVAPATIISVEFRSESSD